MTDQERELMDQFFIRMQAIYRNLWSSAFTTEAMLRQAQKEWLEIFIRAGLTAHDVSDGVTRCKRQFEKPPTPAEFLAILPRRKQAHQVQPRGGLPEPEAHRKARYANGKNQIQKLKSLLNGTQTNQSEDQA